MSTTQELLEKVQSYLPEEKVALVDGVRAFAEECHQGQSRVSGEPYMEHPLHTALFLADLHLDVTTICAALLHDVMEDCGITYDQLSENFGEDVAKLVDGVTKLTRMDLRRMGEDDAGSSAAQEDHLQAESLRKMLVAMAEDIRVVLIKLADRLHNMSTLGPLPPRRRRAIAQETLDIYTPLAHRLGIWDIKWRLEDMAFHYLEPVKYRTISRMLAAKREEREAYVSGIAETLRQELAAVNLEAQVVGRPKHIYSIHRKMQKYGDQGKELSQIYDLYALRVLLETKAECYNALGVVHNLWHPMPGQFDDYIANPKENMYQSLQTSVMCKGGTPLEVQIKTFEMHQIAEYGVAAHWRYKEGGGGDPPLREQDGLASPTPGVAAGSERRRGVRRVGQDRSVPRPGFRLYPQRRYRGASQWRYRYRLRLQDSYRAWTPVYRRQGKWTAHAAEPPSEQWGHRGSADYQGRAWAESGLAQPQPGLRQVR